jgi:hypothetical protein
MASKDDPQSTSEASSPRDDSDQETDETTDVTDDTQRQNSDTVDDSAPDDTGASAESDGVETDEATAGSEDHAPADEASDSDPSDAATNADDADESSDPDPEATDAESDAEMAEKASEDDQASETSDSDGPDDLHTAPPARMPDGGGPREPNDAPDLPDDGPLLGVLAFFDHPERTLDAARATRDSKYDGFDVYTPFPVHGMDGAMGLGRSWIPWVTFVAGLVGFVAANAMQFGMMTFDWPMIIGGKPFAPWPSFVPIMFELTVLIGGVTTGVVMLKAAGCFQEPMILDEDLTDDRFAVWISADDPNFDVDDVTDFLGDLDPTEIRGVTHTDAQ